MKVKYSLEDHHKISLSLWLPNPFYSKNELNPFEKAIVSMESQVGTWNFKESKL